jgi:hypothetical protein
MSLVGLLIVAALSACSSAKQSCAAGSENYQGRCLPPVTAKYLACIDGRGFSFSNEVSVGATLPAVADSTFNVAYKRSKEEDSPVALQIVHDCLTLAEQNATSGADRGTARQYAQQATRYIAVVQQKLPAIELDPRETLTCGSAAVGAQVTCDVTITNTGVAPLQINSVEITGANSGDFQAGGGCVGQSLQPEQSANPDQSPGPDQNSRCTMTVQFQPSAPGERDATLIIHQNLPPPDHGTSLQLVGTGTGQPQSHTLAVTVDATAAAGEVTSNPAGLACPDTCTATFDDGTDITLTATYDHSSGQITWDGCDTSSGDSCMVNLTADRAVTARLVPVVA